MSETHGLALSSEQQVREAVMLQLLKNGRRAGIERDAENIVDYILNGKKDAPKTVKKIQVYLPPNQELEAQAYLLDDGTINIEFQNPEVAQALFSNFDLYGLSFQYNVDTSEDN